MKWLVKSFGAFFIIAASAVFGWLQAKELSCRRQELVYLSGMIDAFRSEICFHRSSLGEIFLMLSERCRKPYQTIFQKIYYGMEQERKSFDETWKTALERIEQETCLKKEDIHCLQGLADITRAADERYIDNIFEAVGKEMEKRKEYLENEYRQKGKVYCWLGITIGVMGVIILI